MKYICTKCEARLDETQLGKPFVITLKTANKMRSLMKLPPLTEAPPPQFFHTRSEFVGGGPDVFGGHFQTVPMCGPVRAATDEDWFLEWAGC